MNNCPEEERKTQARFFRIGNATYIYHQQAGKGISENQLKVYYEEWLQGLPSNIAANMRKRGFDYCKSTMPFTRYVNERTDRGMRDWMKKHLSEEDYRYFMEQRR